MKKGMVLLLIIVTCYMAGMYRSTPLLTIALLEVLLLFVMFFLPHYLKRVLQIGFLSESCVVQKGEHPVCQIYVKNRGMIAAGRFQIKMKVWYQYKKKTDQIKLLGVAGGHGESRLSFEINTPYCGLLELEFERIWFYDYLSLFSSGKKQKDRMKLLVLPKEQAFSIASYCPEWCQRTPFQENLTRETGNEQMEIKQLREYAKGDDIRRIHWKQSARMQQLWVKEYERETDATVDFFLELTKEQTTAEEMDYFYEMVSSILLGFMQQVDRIFVHWLLEGENGEICMEIKDLIGYQEMFLQLYQTDVRKIQTDKERQLFWQFREREQEAFRFNRQLEWYYNENLIIKFNLIKEVPRF